MKRHNLIFPGCEKVNRSYATFGGPDKVAALDPIIAGRGHRSP